MICAMGELLVDFTEQQENEYGYPVLSAAPGGAPANFLCAVKKQGVDASFIGKVGNDAFGRKLISTLKEKGIDTDGIIKADDVFTTLAFVTLDARGERSFSFARKPGADTCITTEEIDLGIIDRSAVFHFGSLSFTDEPAKTSVEYAVGYAKARGKIISYDPNYRPMLWKNEETARKSMTEGFKYADIVKLSIEEALFIFGTYEKEAADILYNDFGCKTVFVTLGEKGCYCKCTAGSFYTKSEKDVVPKDTTGAGDIFTGTAEALMLLKGRGISELTLDEMKEIATGACTVATLSTLRQGGMV